MGMVDLQADQSASAGRCAVVPVLVRSIDLPVPVDQNSPYSAFYSILVPARSIIDRPVPVDQNSPVSGFGSGD
jgi:hypothetical protein